MGVFGVALVPDWLQATLGPGEQPLAFELVTTLTGVRSADGARPPAGLHLNPDALHPAAILGGTEGLLEINPDLLDYWVSGASSTGEAGTLGARLAGPLGDTTALLLTASALYLVNEHRKQVAAVVPRAEIVAFGLAATFTKRARGAVAFRDGSAIYPIFGIFFRGAYRRFERAWLTGQPQS